MPKLNNEGKYEVKITEAFFKPMGKSEDPNAFILVLKCVTPDEYEIFAEMFFTHKVIATGDNTGKTSAEVSCERLAKLGVKDGYPPNLPAAIEQGLHASITTKFEEYKGKTICKVAYINPPSRMKPLSAVNIENLWAKFEGKAPAVDEGRLSSANETGSAPADKDADNIPF